MGLHDVVVDTIPELLLSGALDGAICAREGKKHPDMRYIDLYKERMVIAFPRKHELSPGRNGFRAPNPKGGPLRPELVPCWCRPGWCRAGGKSWIP